MQIKKTVLADEDLIDIYLYGCQNFGQAKAENYFAEINQAFLFLAENPFVSNERCEFDPPVRIHPHGKHLIVYTVEDGFILIIRILHQRMDINRLQRIGQLRANIQSNNITVDDLDQAIENGRL